MSANLVKFFADGSTALIPPLVYRTAEVRSLVLDLDRRGYQLMAHVQRGDSVPMFLDAYDHAIRQNGPRDRRLRSGHDCLVTDADSARFAELAGAQPSSCSSKLGTNFDHAEPTPSDRWHTLRSLGVVLAFGSDRPCTWLLDPLVAMQPLGSI